MALTEEQKKRKARGMGITQQANEAAADKKRAKTPGTKEYNSKEATAARDKKNQEDLKNWKPPTKKSRKATKIKKKKKLKKTKDRK